MILYKVDSYIIIGWLNIRDQMNIWSTYIESANDYIYRPITLYRIIILMIGSELIESILTILRHNIRQIRWTIYVFQ
jgi:hypothetical protein